MKSSKRQLRKLEEAKAANAAAAAVTEPQKETITFDDFQKTDIRVARIVTAEKVAKTKKLRKLTGGYRHRHARHRIGHGVRTDTPEELVGRQVLVVVNLAPRELKGIESRRNDTHGDRPDGKTGTAPARRRDGLRYDGRLTPAGRADKRSKRTKRSCKPQIHLNRNEKH